MMWYIIGMIITFFASTNDEVGDVGMLAAIVMLLAWPMLLGIIVNDIRYELRIARELRTTRHENRC